jgi:hypothetical protein
MKLLFRLTFFVLLPAAALAVLLIGSPYWALFQLRRGLDDGDVARVERVLDLPSFSKSSARIVTALLKARIGVTGVGGDARDPGGRLLGAAFDAVAGAVSDRAAAEAVPKLRRAIAAREVLGVQLPFVPLDGVAAIGAVRSLDAHPDTGGPGAVVTVRGRCVLGAREAPASLEVVLRRHDDGLLGGHPRRHVITGLTRESIEDFVRQCRAATDPAAPR